MTKGLILLKGSLSDHLARADAFLQRLLRWAELRADIRALIVVGSFARGQARPDSDLDVLLLAVDPARFVSDTTWTLTLGEVSSCQLEHYGRVTSVRTRFRNGLDAELSIAPRDWASLPHDSGTLRVACGGIQVLFDRDGDISTLAASLSP